MHNTKASYRDASRGCEKEGGHLAVDDDASDEVISHFDTGRIFNERLSATSILVKILKIF